MANCPICGHRLSGDQIIEENRIPFAIYRNETPTMIPICIDCAERKKELEGFFDSQLEQQRPTADERDKSIIDIILYERKMKATTVKRPDVLQTKGARSFLERVRDIKMNRR